MLDCNLGKEGDPDSMSLDLQTTHVQRTFSGHLLPSDAFFLLQEHLKKKKENSTKITHSCLHGAAIITNSGRADERYREDQSTECSDISGHTLDWHVIFIETENATPLWRVLL